MVLGRWRFVKQQIIDHASDPASGLGAGPDLVSPRPPLARAWPDLCRVLCTDGSRARQELLCVPHLSHVVRRRRGCHRAVAGKSRCLDASCRSRRHRARDSLRSSRWLPGCCRRSGCLLIRTPSASSRPSRRCTMESLLPQPIADQFGWPEMVQRSRRHLQLAAAGRARRNRHLGRQLWRSRSDESVRPAIRTADAPTRATRTTGIGDRRRRSTKTSS